MISHFRPNFNITLTLKLPLTPPKFRRAKNKASIWPGRGAVTFSKYVQPLTLGARFALCDSPHAASKGETWLHVIILTDFQVTGVETVDQFVKYGHFGWRVENSVGHILTNSRECP